MAEVSTLDRNNNEIKELSYYKVVCFIMLSSKSGFLLIKNYLIHSCFQIGLFFYVFILRLTKWVRPQRSFPKSGPVDILLTGKFLTDNWIISLLQPLALSIRCRRIRFVSSTQMPLIDNVEPIYPPKLLVRLVGKTSARLATFLWIGIHTSPHIIGGLHLLLNGLTAILLAKLTGSIALYNCCGGPGECCGEGGEKRENRLFSKLHGPDPVIEHLLLEAVAAADLVITRGNLAIQYFQEHKVSTQFHVVPGGIDGNIFSLVEVPAEYDLIIVGRIAPVKRMEIFLQVVNKVRAVRSDIRAVILGDGPLRESLETYARELNLHDIVCFAGYQNDVASWLQRAKIFVLTSESEGLSQAMIQAMLCGLPAVVTHVGEAEELIQNGVNGFLVRDMDVNFFAESILRLLDDQTMLSNFGKAARQSAERCDVHQLARKWDEILNGLA